VNKLVPRDQRGRVERLHGMGATLVNSLGTVHAEGSPMAEGAPRYLLTPGNLRELKKGGAPAMSTPVFVERGPWTT